MTALSITADDVAAVKILEQMTGPAGEAIAAGAVVRLDTSTGKFVNSKTDTEAHGRITGIAIKDASAAGMTITVVVQGWIDLGNALSGVGYDGIVYGSDTAGGMGDAAGTAEWHVGRVIPAWGATTADKLLRIEPVFVPAAT